MSFGCGAPFIVTSGTTRSATGSVQWVSGPPTQVVIGVGYTSTTPTMGPPPSKSTSRSPPTPTDGDGDGDGNGVGTPPIDAGHAGLSQRAKIAIAAMCGVILFGASGVAVTCCRVERRKRKMRVRKQNQHSPDEEDSGDEEVKVQVLG